MRIFFISTASRPEIGGIQNCLDGWLEGLALLGHDVRMLGIATDEMIDLRQSLSPRSYTEQWIRRPERTPARADWFLPVRKARTLQFIRERRGAIITQCLDIVRSTFPDCVVFGMLDPVAYDVQPHLQELGIPCVAVAYGTEVHPLRLRRSRWQRIGLLSSDLVITISAYTRELCLALGVPSGMIEVVHPALVDQYGRGNARDKETIGTADDALRILTICRLIERKGVQVIIEAVQRLRPRYPALRYDVVGDGPFRESLEELVERYDLGGIVWFHGAVHNGVRDQLLRDCHVFVMAPFETEEHDVEGFGIVYLEAGLYGKAVIGSRSGGVPDAVLHEETGLLVAPQDVKETTAALAALLDDAELRHRLGTGGARWAELHLPAAIAATFETALTGLLNRSPRIATRST